MLSFITYVIFKFIHLIYFIYYIQLIEFIKCLEYIPYIIPLIINYYIYGHEYCSLINCSILSFTSFLKLLVNSYIVNNIQRISMISSLLFYFVDIQTFLKKENKYINGINEKYIYIIHHICACEILLNKLYIEEEAFSFFLLMFCIELSSVIHNLYDIKYINRNVYKYSYSTLRILSNVIYIYYYLFDLVIVNNILYNVDFIMYVVLFFFNIGGVILCLK